MNNNNFKKNENELGALWIKENNNSKYLTGYIDLGNEKLNIVIFKNKNKKSDKAPDYKIFKKISNKNE